MKGLYYISISSNDNPPLVTSDIVRIFYDEIADEFFVTKNGVQILSGPTLGPSSSLIVPPFGSPFFQINYFVFSMNDVGDADFSAPQYQFCEISTLIFFKTAVVFPYATKEAMPNHPSCVSNVCDIIIRGTPQIIKPTDFETPDGQITIVGESSIGIVKYGFTDAPYASLPNTTGIFSGLYPGTYLIYAKDANGCTVTISVTLQAAFNYSPKYRLQYMPVKKYDTDVVYPTRIDILEQDYIGDPVEVKAVDESFTLRMRGDNLPLFTPIMSTECSLQLLSETDLQFLPIFTQSDRKYQMRHQKDFGVGFTELWRGWTKPGLYRESYISDRDYSVTIEATDNTSNLSKQKFSDDSGAPITSLTKVIEIVAIILKKTGLDLPIHVADNMYDIAMDTLVSDDPLNQTYIIPNEVFAAGVMCDAVLNNLIGSKGGRIVQWKKAWWVIRLDELVTDLVYRVFDKDGALESNSTYAPLRSIADTPGVGEFTWVNARQDLDIYPAVGKMTTRHNLLKIPNGIKNGGFDKFEFTKITDAFGGQNFQITAYPGWSLILNDNTASYAFIASGLSKTHLTGNGDQPSNSNSTNLANALTLFKDGRINKTEYDTIVARITKDDLPNYALLISSASNNSVYGEDAYVLSADQPIVFSGKDGAKFSFDYFTNATKSSQIEPPFIKFKISFRLDNTYFLQADGSWSTDAAFEWIEVVVNSGKFQQWVHIDILALFPPVVGTVDGIYTVKIMNGSFPYEGWIIGDETALRAVPSVNLPEGYKLTTRHQVSSTEIYRFYEIVSDKILTDNSPEVIHPDDYGTFNPPAFVIGTTYAKGAKVKDGGNFYISTHDSNLGHSPGLSPLDWAAFAGRVIWKLISEIKTGVLETAGYYGVKTVTANKFDNVAMEFLPLGETAPEFKDYIVINDANIDNDLAPEYIIGDAPFDINNSKNIYQNIYRLSDRTATSQWFRRGVTEQQSVLALLSKQYVEQLQKPRFRLSGDLSGFVNFIDSFQEKGRKFIPISIEIRDFNNETTIEMIELTAPGQTNPFDLGEFKNEEFGVDFDI